MSFLEGWMLADEYRHKADIEKAKRNPAELRGADHCVQCGFCCAYRTCIPLPTEIPAIAEFLGITVEELIKNYMVADQTGRENVTHLKWINTLQHDVAGTFLGFRRTYDFAPCVFLQDDNTCKIYPVRPQNAKNCKCWEKTEYPGCCWAPDDIQQFADFVDLDDPDDWDDDWEEDE